VSRILVADDSPVARAAVSRRLRGSGREVVEADSAHAASGIDGTTLGCALLDLDLGDGWGPDVADALRTAHAGLPVAFFTSAADETAALVRARTLGPVFSKPSDLERAVAWVLAAS
jgi:CheY-like chemotaxis protein